MGAMVKLKEQGKIRAIGVSNYDEQWLARAIRVAPVASNQPPYSIISRGIEAKVLPFSREHDVATIVYSPMERGLLTGAVTMDRVAVAPRSTPTCPGRGARLVPNGSGNECADEARFGPFDQPWSP